MFAVGPLVRANALAARIGRFPDRHMDYAQNRLMVLDQRDVDSEFTIAADKLPGAIERIDQPVRIPLATFPEIREPGLLGEYRQIRGQLLEARHDDMVRRHVCLRERGLVILGLYIEIACVHFENRLARLGSQDNDRINEL
jgi:hypothetical protein